MNTSWRPQPSTMRTFQPSCPVACCHWSAYTPRCDEMVTAGEVTALRTAEGSGPPRRADGRHHRESRPQTHRYRGHGHLRRPRRREGAERPRPLLHPRLVWRATRGAGAAGLVMISVAVGLDFGLSNQTRAPHEPARGCPPVRSAQRTPRTGSSACLFALHDDRRRRRAGRARDLVRFERAAPFSLPQLPNDLRRRHRDPRVPNGATHHGRSLRHRRQLLLLDIPVADGGYGLAWRATNPAPGTAPSCASSSTGSPFGAWVRVE